jgi:hypothetical protein
MICTWGWGRGRSAVGICRPAGSGARCWAGWPTGLRTHVDQVVLLVKVVDVDFPVLVEVVPSRVGELFDEGGDGVVGGCKQSAIESCQLVRQAIGLRHSGVHCVLPGRSAGSRGRALALAGAVACAHLDELQQLGEGGVLFHGGQQVGEGSRGARAGIGVRGNEDGGGRLGQRASHEGGESHEDELRLSHSAAAEGAASGCAIGAASGLAVGAAPTPGARRTGQQQGARPIAGAEPKSPGARRGHPRFEWRGPCRAAKCGGERQRRAPGVKIAAWVGLRTNRGEGRREEGQRREDFEAALPAAAASSELQEGRRRGNRTCQSPGSGAQLNPSVSIKPPLPHPRLHPAIQVGGGSRQRRRCRSCP